MESVIYICSWCYPEKKVLAKYRITPTLAKSMPQESCRKHFLKMLTDALDRWDSVEVERITEE